MDIDARRFTATDIGKIVNRFLTKYFTKYVEYGFTADMEDELDAVSRGEEPWVTPLEKFWKPFIDQVERDREPTSAARKSRRRATSASIRNRAGRCRVRMGRFGPFVQIGTKDDEEKPKFAGPAARPEDGHHHARRRAGAVPAAAQARRDAATGEPMTVAIGRFGPYVKYGAKYVSLKEDDPYTVTLERAHRGHRGEEGRRCQPHHPATSASTTSRC